MTKFFNRRGLVLALSALAAGVTSLSRLLAQKFGKKENETTWIEPEALARALGEKAGWIVVDVRNPEEFAGPAGHIQDARNIPVDRLVSAPSNLGLPKEHPIVMVCLTDKRSDRAAKALHAAGFSQIFVLRGGMQRWSAERRHVEQAALQA